MRKKITEIGLSDLLPFMRSAVIITQPVLIIVRQYLFNKHTKITSITKAEPRFAFAF